MDAVYSYDMCVGTLLAAKIIISYQMFVKCIIHSKSLSDIFSVIKSYGEILVYLSLKDAFVGHFTNFDSRI